MGKFVIRAVPSGIKFDLKATNGEVISTSEVYTRLVNCKKGVQSVKTNAPAANIEDQTAEEVVRQKCPKFEVYKDKAGEFRFRLKSVNGQIVASSGEGYTTKAACLNGVDSVKRNAPEAEVIDTRNTPAE